jgi:glycosyltransferase involved in cell wall biosynthesis
MTLRILEIVDVRWWNGSAHHGIVFATAMAGRGHDVSVAGIPDSPALREAEARGIPTISHRGFRSRDPLHFPGAVGLVGAEIAHRGIQVVNAHRGEGHLVAGLARIRSGSDVPLFRTHADVRAPRANLANRWLYGAATARVLVAARFLEPAVRDATGVEPSRIALVPPALDTRRFRPLEDREAARAALAIPPGAFAVGVVARLSRVKGHAVFLEAMAGLAPALPHLHLVFATLDAEEKTGHLEAALEAKGLVSRASVVGRVPGIERVIGALDLLAVPSLGSEAVSRVALEALAMEVPIVASRVGGLPDLFEDPDADGLVPPGDPAALAGAVMRLATRPDEARRLGADGRLRVLDRHSLDALGARLETLYAAPGVPVE